MVPLGGAPSRARRLRRDHGLRRRHASRSGRPHPWLTDEVAFLADALAARVPLFGVCLGSQLIARAQPVRGSARRGESEVGWLEVELTDAGRADPVLSALPERVDAFQWHSYTFALPEGANELATSPVGAPGVLDRPPRVGHPVPRRGDATDDRGLGRRVRRRAARCPPAELFAATDERIGAVERAGPRPLPRVPRVAAG